MSRCVLDGVLSLEECMELMFIQRSLAVQGYRPHVTSLTLHDLCCCQPELLLPVVRARQKLWTAVEKCLGCEFELFPEFTALIAWGPASNLGWHTDENRDYLKQRHVSAVLYLNRGGGVDFTGGNFMFRSPAEQVVPIPGRLVCFLSQDEEHAVDAVSCGERQTLTMWFTRHQEAAEDLKVLSQLVSLPPVPHGVPDTMYLEKGGGDVRLKRLNRLGVDTAQWSNAQAAHPLPDCHLNDEVVSWVHTANSLQDAGLRAHFADWLLHSGDTRQTSHATSTRCCCHTQCSSPACNELHAYFFVLKAQLPRAILGWQQAGLLYDD